MTRKYPDIIIYIKVQTGGGVHCGFFHCYTRAVRRTNQEKAIETTYFYIYKSIEKYSSGMDYETLSSANGI